MPEIKDKELEINEVELPVKPAAEKKRSHRKAASEPAAAEAVPDAVPLVAVPPEVVARVEATAALTLLPPPELPPASCIRTGE